MKILVIGGMHGNEMLGIDLVRSLQQKPILGIDYCIANPRAVEASTRYTSEDLNRSFPGKETTGTYESVRARSLLRKASSYDLVIDFHNTYCPNNDCAFVGEKAESLLFDVAAYFNLKRVVVADYDCINKYAQNCISVEISVSSPQNSVAIWRQKLAALIREGATEQKATVEKYRFVYRMSLEDRDQYNLAEKNLRAFKALDDDTAQKMRVASPAYPIFINDKFTPYNFGGLLNRLPD
mgnify:CR=1 FL=1